MVKKSTRYAPGSELFDKAFQGPPQAVLVVDAISTLATLVTLVTPLGLGHGAVTDLKTRRVEAHPKLIGRETAA